MNRRQLSETAVIMALAFAVTLLVLRSPTKSRATQPFSVRTLLPISPNTSQHATLPVLNLPPVRQPEVTQPPASQPEPVPAIDVPASDENGPPLPLLFTVSSHPSLPRSEDDISSTPGTDRQVDLVNNSDELLNVTVIAVDPPTQEKTLAQILMPPHQRTQVGVDAGVKLEPGYQVTLRSRGYQEMSQVVN